MKNKKGFTLVELLAVIAILAILVIIALPNVLKLFNEAKKKIFLTEAQTIYKEATKKYINESVKGNKISKISSENESTLKMDGENVKYCILLNSEGKVTSMKVTNGDYYIEYDGDTIENLDISNIVENNIEYDWENCRYPETDVSCFEYQIANNAVTIKEYKCGKGTANENLHPVIPSYIEGKPVKYIGYGAFQGTRITGFLDLSNLENLVSIGMVAFADNGIGNDVGITGVKFPESIESIEYAAFTNNDIEGFLDLSNLKNLKSLSGFCWNKITGVKLPSTLLEFDDYVEGMTYNGVFASNKIKGDLDLSNLTNITNIPVYAFYNNEITNIKLPSSIERLQYGCFESNQIAGTIDFSSNTNLKNIEGNEYYHSGAFKNNNMSKVILPSSVENISSTVFDNCNNLTEIKINKTTDSVEYSPWGATNATVIWK